MLYAGWIITKHTWYQAAYETLYTMCALYTTSLNNILLHVECVHCQYAVY